MFAVIGRIVAFFALLALFVGCGIAGSLWWVAAHAPANLRTPEQIKQFQFASLDHFFSADYPFVIAGAVLLSALIAFKPRWLTVLIAGPVAALFFFTASSNVPAILNSLHALHPEYYSRHSTPGPAWRPTKPAPLAAAPALPAGPPELAPPGVFYLLTAAHAETKDGVIGVPPGTRVTLLQPGLYLTPAGKLRLDETQLTNDLAKARRVLAYDQNAQTALHATTIAVDTIMFHGIRTVPVQINGILTRNFIVDSGASNITVPTALVTELTQSGTLKESDYLPGYGIFVTADGSKLKRRRFLLHTIRVGETTVTDVVASDAGPNGALLLGMSFLTKARAVYDTQNGKLIFNR